MFFIDLILVTIRLPTLHFSPVVFERDHPKVGDLDIVIVVFWNRGRRKKRVALSATLDIAAVDLV